MSNSFATLCDVASETPIVAGIVLGSGTNGIIDQVNSIISIPFDEVPGLATTSVDGHHGRATIGDWSGKRVIVFEGRLHFYEGQPWSCVVRPVQIAHELGARILLATNAAGGIHPSLAPGSLMVVQDHILWNVPRPWLQAGPGA